MSCKSWISSNVRLSVKWFLFDCCTICTLGGSIFSLRKNLSVLGVSSLITLSLHLFSCLVIWTMVVIRCLYCSNQHEIPYLWSALVVLTLWCLPFKSLCLKRPGEIVDFGMIIYFMKWTLNINYNTFKIYQIVFSLFKYYILLCINDNELFLNKDRSFSKNYRKRNNNTCLK